MKAYSQNPHKLVPFFFPQADAREAKNHFQSEWAPFNGLAVRHCFLQGVRTPPLLAGLTTILSSSAVACESVSGMACNWSRLHRSSCPLALL